MKLIRCHVDNFGKLTDYSYIFQDGCNVICEDNGWGKSTFAAFIRVMLFGFDNEGKRNRLENERERYRPWQKGSYGGELVFEVNSTAYRVRRAFGAKNKDDDFELTFAATNLPCGDFSENLGEELFQIDAASFERTVFFSQNDCGSETTDRINAKIGNITESSDDLDQYEAAVERLAELLNKLSPRRVTGLIKKEKSRETELVKTIRDRAGIEETIRQVQEKQDEYKRANTALEQAQRELQEKQKEAGAALDLGHKRAEYERLQTEYKERGEAKEQAERFFKGIIPSRDEIKQYAQECNASVQSARMCEMHELGEKEKQELIDLQMAFPGGIPSKEELWDAERQAQEYADAERESLQYRLSEDESERLERYAKKYSVYCPSEAEQNKGREQWQQCTDRAGRLLEKEYACSASEAALSQKMREVQEERNRRKRAALSLALGTGFLLAGVICLILEFVPVGIIACILGAGLFIVGIRNHGNSSLQAEAETQKKAYGELFAETERERAELAAEREKLKLFCDRCGIPFAEETFLAEMELMRSETEDFHKLCLRRNEYQNGSWCAVLAQNKENLDAFLQKYGSAQQNDTAALSASRYISDVHSLAENVRRLCLLQEKQKESEKYRAQAKHGMMQVKAFVERLGFEAQSDLAGQLAEMEKQLGIAEAARAELARAKEAKEAFEKKEDVPKLLTVSMPADAVLLEEIAEQLNQNAEEMSRNQKHIAEYARQLQDLREGADALQETREELGALREKLKEDEKHYVLLEKTKQYLEQAKSSFTARYTEPIMSGFRKYYRILTGADCDNIQMDADTKISVVEQSLTREIGFLSAGRKDLLGVCIRMALIEAMYRDEKPFLIMDDPFVNLDVKKTQGAMEFLEQVAGEYQCLYFTCHESRSKKSR